MKLAKNEKVMEGKIQKILFLVAGFAMGDYLETAPSGQSCLRSYYWHITGDEERKNSGMGNGKCLDDAGRISFYDDGTGTLKNKLPHPVCTAMWTILSMRWIFM